MMRFEYYEPETLEEAVVLLGRHNGQASVLAGGTDLLIEIKEQIKLPEYVINIKKIPGLDYLTYEDGVGLKIGALVTARAVEKLPVVVEKYAALAQAVTELGSIQVRNRATVIGNLCRASPSADTPPPLIADGARVTIFGPAGERELALEEFFTGPGQTVLAKDEILKEVAVPSPSARSGKVYIKHGRRKAMELATVGVAVTLALEGEVCAQIKIVLGAVAPTPIRVRTAEDTLRGSVINEEVIEAAARAAMEESRPISDVRSSAEYRHEMVRVLTGRAVRGAFDIAGAN